MKQSKLQPKILCCVVAAFMLSACATDDFGNRRLMTDTTKGAIIGAVGGAVTGAAVSGSSDREKGALIGAIGGGLAGGAVGNYMDRQKQDLQKVLTNEINAGAIDIDQVGGDKLRITMTNQTAFDVDSFSIKPGFYSSMDKLSNVIKRYGKTTQTIVGHTDSTGSDEYNQALSERRSQAVVDYFLQAGVHPTRLSSFGRGESEPRASNETETGRQLNRRVEITVAPVIAE